MTKIRTLMEHIECEVEDAQHYADLALEYKGSDADLAECYRRLAEEELGHMDKLHSQVVRLINEYKRGGKEPPADMMAVYEYLHKRAVKDAECVNVALGMYKK